MADLSQVSEVYVVTTDAGNTLVQERRPDGSVVTSIKPQAAPNGGLELDAEGRLRVVGGASGSQEGASEW